MSGEPPEDGEVNEMRNRIRNSSPSGLHDLRFYKQAALTSSPPPPPFSGGDHLYKDSPRPDRVIWVYGNYKYFYSYSAGLVLVSADIIHRY